MHDGSFRVPEPDGVRIIGTLFYKADDKNSKNKKDKDSGSLAISSSVASPASSDQERAGHAGGKYSF